MPVARAGGIHMDAGTKPSFPWHLLLLGGIAVFGLIAQLVAGEAAFALLGYAPRYSWAMSLWLLAVPIIAAIHIMKSSEDGLDIIAVVVVIMMAAMSGIFNFTWISSELPELHWIQVMAYSVCPLLLLYWIGFSICVKTMEWRS